MQKSGSQTRFFVSIWQNITVKFGIFKNKV